MMMVNFRIGFRINDDLNKTSDTFSRLSQKGSTKNRTSSHLPFVFSRNIVQPAFKMQSCTFLPAAPPQGFSFYFIYFFKVLKSNCVKYSIHKCRRGRGQPSVFCLTRFAVCAAQQGVLNVQLAYSCTFSTQVAEEVASDNVTALAKAL